MADHNPASLASPPPEPAATKRLRIFVVVATLGRPEIVRDTVRHLERQTRLPDGVVISTVRAGDAGGSASAAFDVRVIVGEKGLCRQRNAGIDAVAGRADVILFLDDDFVAADDYLAALEQVLLEQPDVAGVTGWVLADGITGEGYTFEQAVDLVGGDAPAEQPALFRMEALYGCNMAIRLSATGDMRFDEALPLYGWLEDIDFTYRAGWHGGLVRAKAMRGVHMGTKGGRTSGVRLGYSQLANPIYLLRKRSIPRWLAYTMMRNNVLANLGRCLAPEPHIDRIGRLRGNLHALFDLLRGRLDPRRILELE